jgi:hypothetical protein
MSRLRAIPFTADMPAGGLPGTLTAGRDGLTSTGADGAWSIPLTAPPAPERSPHHRWFRRGMTGALTGIGIGVAVLAVSLPAADGPDRDVPPPGSVAGGVRETVPDERTEIVPPVVRTLTVGADTGPSSGGTP